MARQRCAIRRASPEWRLDGLGKRNKRIVFGNSREAKRDGNAFNIGMTLIIIIIVLVLLFGGGGYAYRGAAGGGGGLGLILLILLVLYFLGYLHR